MAAHLAKIFSFNDWSNRAIWRKYYPYALQFLRNTKALDSNTRYNLCLAVGRCLQADGRVGEAVIWLQKYFFGRQEHLVKDHTSRLASQHALAMAYWANGQVTEVVKLLEHVVVVEETVSKEDYPDRLASQHALLSLYAQQRADGED